MGVAVTTVAVTTLAVTLAEAVVVGVTVPEQAPARAAMANRADQQAGADTSDQQAATDTEPTEHGFSGERGGQREREAEQEHATGVGPGDGGAHEDRIAHRTLPTGDVRGHHRLAVARQQRVRGPEQQRQCDRQQSDAECQLTTADEIVEDSVDPIDRSGEEAFFCTGHAVGNVRGFSRCTVAGNDVERGFAHVQRRVQQIDRIVAEVVGDAVLRHR